MKRFFNETTDELIANNPNGDALWNLALDFQEKAVKKNGAKDALKYFKRALKVAKASRNQYIEDASKKPEQQDENLQNAKLAEKELIKPFKKRIKKLKIDLETIESKGYDIAVQSEIRHGASSVQLEATPTPTVLQVSTFFASIGPNNIGNLLSLQGFESLDEIDFITGTPLEKIQLLVNRLSSVIRSKIIQTELPDNEIKLVNADALIDISRDCTQKLLNWIKPYSLEDGYYDLASGILQAGQSASKAAKTIYGLFYPTKVRVCKAQLVIINQEIEKLESQSNVMLDL